MIYLNNSSTSFPKPACVIEAVNRSMLNPPFAEGRGGNFDPSNPNFDLSDRLRKSLGRFFGIDEYKQIVFTSGASESLNLAIRGLNLGQSKSDVIVSPIEHNSVWRP